MSKRAKKGRRGNNNAKHPGYTRKPAKDLITGESLGFAGKTLQSNRVYEFSAEEYLDFFRNETGQRQPNPYPNSIVRLEVEIGRDSLILTGQVSAGADIKMSGRNIFTINKETSKPGELRLTSAAQVTRVGEEYESGYYWTYPDDVIIQAPLELTSWIRAANAIASKSYSADGYGKSVVAEYTFEGGTLVNYHPTVEARSLVMNFGSGNLLNEEWWKDPFAPNLI